jgi:hypothetical protein
VNYQLFPAHRRARLALGMIALLAMGSCGMLLPADLAVRALNAPPVPVPAQTPGLPLEGQLPTVQATLSVQTTSPVPGLSVSGHAPTPTSLTDQQASPTPGADSPVSDSPVTNPPQQEPVISDPGQGPISSDPGPGQGPVTGDPGQGPVSSDPGHSRGPIVLPPIKLPTISLPPITITFPPIVIPPIPIPGSAAQAARFRHRMHAVHHH